MRGLRVMRASGRLAAMLLAWTVLTASAEPVTDEQAWTAWGADLGQAHSAVPAADKAQASPLGVKAALYAQLEALKGIRYRYGSTNPTMGLDCSGMVVHLWSVLGLPELPRSSYQMAQRGQPIELSQLRPGDLVFFNTLRKQFSHVGVYIGNGRFIHASSVLKRVTEDALSDRYYRTRFDGARRMLDY